MRFMNLAQAGIALKCLCGADMASDMADVLFHDKGQVKISGRPVHCQRCGAVYKYGERLKYRLVSIDYDL
jgi:hypothetical protein